MNFKITDVIEDLSNEEYHSHGTEIISSSFVKDVAKGNVQKALDNEIEENDALIFGDLFHTAMEQGGMDKLSDRIHLWDDATLIEDLKAGKYNGKEYKAPTMTNVYNDAKAEAEESARGKIIVSPLRLQMLEAMQQAANSHALISHMDDSSQLSVREEVSYFATEQESGIKVRIRPDREYRDAFNGVEAIVDWKTTSDIETFKSSFWKYRYDIQAIFYCDVLDIGYDKWYYVAVEKSLTPECRVYTLSEQTIERAREDLNHAWDQIVRWRNTGLTTPPNDVIITI